MDALTSFGATPVVLGFAALAVLLLIVIVSSGIAVLQTLKLRRAASARRAQQRLRDEMEQTLASMSRALVEAERLAEFNTRAAARRQAPGEPVGAATAAPQPAGLRQVDTPVRKIH
jgi:hypothetical protein